MISHHSSRRNFLKSAGFGSAVLTMPWWFHAGASVKDNLPNFIVIVADDLGYGDLQCYGSNLNSTPHLDLMAKEGMLFTNFYTASAMCTPSRAALMTGCYPQRVGFSRLENEIGHVLLAGEHFGLNPNEITIPELLKTKGYATKMVGKWHLGDQPSFLPTRQGFDSFFGLPYSHDVAPDHPLSSRFNFPPLPLLRNENVIEENPDRSQLTQRFTQDAINFIQEAKHQPFFLYFAHTLPHYPLLPPREFLGKSKNGPYGAYVELLDYCTGELLDAVRKANIDNKTLIIFTSDNGAAEVEIQPGDNGPLRGQKGQTYEGGMRVPCIMRWPETIPAQTVCHELTTTMDFLPTFVTIIRSRIPDDRIIDGKNILPLLEGKSGVKTPYEAFYYLWMDELHAVRSGFWKLVFKLPHKPNFEKAKLYNLDNDIGEEHDIADEHQEIVKRLEGLADECRNDLGDAATEVKGKNVRPLGWVDHPTTLTTRPSNIK